MKNQRTTTVLTAVKTIPGQVFPRTRKRQEFIHNFGGLFLIWVNERTMHDLLFGVLHTFDLVLVILKYTLERNAFKSMRLVSKGWKEVVTDFAEKIYAKTITTCSPDHLLRDYIIEKMVMCFRNTAQEQRHIFCLESDVNTTIAAIVRHGSGCFAWTYFDGIYWPNLVRKEISDLNQLFRQTFVNSAPDNGHNVETICSGVKKFFRFESAKNVALVSTYNDGPEELISFKTIMGKKGADPNLMWLYRFFYISYFKPLWGV